MAIYRFFLQQKLPVQIATAVFTDPRSPACEICRDLGIKVQVIPCRDMPAFEESLLELVQSQKPDLIALCGFMRLLSADLISALSQPVLNVHPALLPKYGGPGMYGMAVHEAVFKAGESISGATVHSVDPIYDHGPIVAQKAVDISSCQSPEEIAAKVLRVEHEIYAQTIYDELSKA